jgi:hypothetical protein
VVEAVRRREGQPLRAALGVHAWRRRLVVFALGLGVVVMHHVVGAHQNGAGPNAVAEAESATAEGGVFSLLGSAQPVMAMTGSHTGSSGLTLDGVDAGATTETHSREGLESVHDDHGMGISMLMHLCLAVLGATLVLLALVLFALWWRADRRPASPPWPTGSPSRAPPVPERLAQLQVLRL